MEAEKLNRREILRYLGCHADAPEELAGMVDWGCEILCAAARPKSLWRSFPLSGTHLEGTTVTLQGADIALHLKDCTSVLLMAATLGAEVERLLMRWEVRDLSRAMVLDACASCLVEAECSRLEGELRFLYEYRGHHVTSRYSPGYGDLPLSHQGEILELLNAQRQAGLTLSPSGLLIPRKSVTAVLGVSPDPVRGHAAGCQRCAIRDRCTYRKGGQTCG